MVFHSMQEALVILDVQCSMLGVVNTEIGDVEVYI